MMLANVYYYPATILSFFKTLKKLQNFKKQQKFQIAKSPPKNGIETQNNLIKKLNFENGKVQKVRSDYFFSPGSPL